MATASVIPIPTVNPHHHHIKHDETGERALMVVFVLMFVSTLIFGAMAFRLPASKRLLSMVTCFITAFATISYFCMAVGMGSHYTKVETSEHHKNNMPTVHKEQEREFLYPRYIDWALTTPLLLLDLGILAGMSGADLTVAIVADEVMIVTGLLAAVASTETAKWGLYAMANVALLVIIYVLAMGGRKMAMSQDKKVGTLFNSLAVFTLILWCLYPVVWAVGEGASKISPNAEIICYAILDVLAKPIFGFWLIFAHSAIPSAQLNMKGAWSTGFGTSEGSLRVGDDDDGA